MAILKQVAMNGSSTMEILAAYLKQYFHIYYDIPIEQLRLEDVFR